MGSFLADSSVHLAGNGRNRFTFLFGVLQPGTGHLEVTNHMPWMEGLVLIQSKQIQCSPFIMLYLGSIIMDHVLRE